MPDPMIFCPDLGCHPPRSKANPLVSNTPGPRRTVVFGNRTHERIKLFGCASIPRITLRARTLDAIRTNRDPHVELRRIEQQSIAQAHSMPFSPALAYILTLENDLPNIRTSGPLTPCSGPWPS